MDTSPVSAAVASAIPSDTPLALNALLIMAHVHGVAASGEDLLHRFSAFDSGFGGGQAAFVVFAGFFGALFRAVDFGRLARLHFGFFGEV